MTREDATTVGRVLIQADGGCSVCVRELFLAAMKAFPKHDWKEIAKEVGFEEEHWEEET